MNIELLREIIIRFPIDPTGPKWTDVAQVAIQLGGVGFIIWQIWDLRASLQSTTHSSIYSHYADTVKVVLDKPHLYGYLRGGLRLVDKTSALAPEAADILRAEVSTICELTTTLFEHAWLERSNMPDETWKSCWQPYMRASYEASSELRDFYHSHEIFYVTGFKKFIRTEIALKIAPVWRLDD